MSANLSASAICESQAQSHFTHSTPSSIFMARHFLISGTAAAFGFESDKTKCIRFKDRITPLPSRAALDYEIIGLLTSADYFQSRLAG
jgi:hypothetical protein